MLERPSRGRRFTKWLLGGYMRRMHQLVLENPELLPARGPALVLLNHSSVLDVPALMVLDPYPDTITIAKASLFRVPIVSWCLRQWGAIAVERQGRDSSGVRALFGALREGRVVAIAAEGTRSRSGRLGPINPVLARVAASSGVPLVPVGIVGSFEALPPGALLPRRKKIRVRIGRPFQLDRGTDAAVAAQRIRQEIAVLLTPEQQPIDDDDPQPHKAGTSPSRSQTR